MGENKRKSKKNNTTKSKTKTKTKTKKQYYGGELLKVGQQQKGLFGKLMSKKPSNDIRADKYLTTFSVDEIFKHQSSNGFKTAPTQIPCFPHISKLKPKTTEKLSLEDFNVGYRFARCLTINDQGEYDYDSKTRCTMDEAKYNRFIEKYFCGPKDVRNKCKSIKFEDINGGSEFDFDKFYLLYWFLYYVPKSSIILTENPYEELRKKILWKYPNLPEFKNIDKLHDNLDYYKTGQEDWDLYLNIRTNLKLTHLPDDKNDLLTEIKKTEEEIGERERIKKKQKLGDNTTKYIEYIDWESFKKLIKLYPPTQTTAGGRRRRKRSTRNKRKSNKKRRSVKGKSKKNTQSKKHRYYTGGKGNGKSNSASTNTKRPLSVAKTQQIKSQYKTNPHTGTYSEADRRSLIKKGVRLTKKRSL